MIFLLVSLARGAGGTGGIPESSRTGDHRKVLRLGLDVPDFENLDPHFAAGYPDRLVVDMIYNALVRYSPGNVPNIEPDLARNIPEPFMEDGRQVWIFQLKTGVFFHSGPVCPAHELTADDVVFSLGKAADPFRSRYAGAYTGLTVEKIDDFTVKITNEKPLSPRLFLSRIANYSGGFIMSRKAVEKMGEEAVRTRPVGTGPFCFGNYSPKEKKLVLDRNPLYFRGAPLLDGVEIRFYENRASLLSAFKKGLLDVIKGEADTQWIRDAAQEADVSVDVFGVPKMAGLRFNTLVKPLSDLRVRQAMAHALNRNEFLEDYGAGHTSPACSPAPAQFLPGGLSGEEVEVLGLDYNQDLDKAKKLLAEAGYPSGFFLDIVISDLNPQKRNYERLIKQLAAINVILHLHLVDHSTMDRLFRDDLNPIALYEVFMPNIDDFLTRFFHSDSLELTEEKPEANFSNYNGIDRIIELARAEPKSSAQIKLWNYAQLKILEDMVVYPLYYRGQVYARKNRVEYGHFIRAAMALYPQITEATRIKD